MSRESASQTAGPYVHIGLLPNAAGLPMYNGDLVHDAGAKGDQLELTGQVFDGAGMPVTDALLEFWQAPGEARDASGWRRTATDDEGRYTVTARRQSALPDQAPHIIIWIVARGIGLALQTRVYFEGEPANDTDPVLRRIPAERRSTLIAGPKDGRWHMNIVLQGPDETVFLDM